MSDHIRDRLIETESHFTSGICVQAALGAECFDGVPRASDLRDFSDIELTEHIGTARKELFGLRFQHATGELDNTATLNRAKREIARALTVAREREIEAES